MPSSAARPARSAAPEQELVPLSSVDDLHDAEFAQLLADRLADSAVALRATVAAIARRL